MITNNSSFNSIHKATELELFVGIINKHLEDAQVPTIIHFEIHDKCIQIIDSTGETIDIDADLPLPQIIEELVGATDPDQPTVN